jgi:hypothetical protein
MKFLLVYTPEGDRRQEFVFDVDNPLNLEAEALESVGGDVWDSWPEFLMKAGSGNIRARRALLWAMLRRSNPDLRFSDVVFNLSEFVIEEEIEEEPAGKGEPGDGTTGSESPQPDTEPLPSS